jgi:hypothetical protein
MDTTIDIIICDDSAAAFAPTAISDCDDSVLRECACGCTRQFAVAIWLLEEPQGNRARQRYRPREYCEEHGDFVISGSTGYMYASRRCLNMFNEN